MALENDCAFLEQEREQHRGNVYRPIYYIPENQSEKRDIWPGLMEDSDIYPHLKKFGNTIMSYKHCEILVRHVWHMYFSKHFPKDVRTNKKYENKYNFCLQMIEKYITKHLGMPVRLRYVVSQKARFNNNGTIYYVPYNPTSEMTGDFWVIEVIK